jgi:alkaline phosphatase D
LLGGGARPPSTQRDRRRRALLTGTSALSLVLSLAALFLAATGGSRSSSSLSRRSSDGASTISNPSYTVFFLDDDDDDAKAPSTTTTRLSAGSCTSYDLRPQPVWTRGVIPFDPHAWVWLGDMSYLDDAPIDCGAALAEGADDAAEAAGCWCPSDWLRRPGGCFAADLAHAARRAQHQLAVSEYQAFVAHMCPSSGASPSPSSQPAHFPPPPAACKRPILGIWDDHDYGANNGDARNPAKAQIKELYLDMIGEPKNSARRGSADGLQAEYRFNFRGSGNESEEGKEAIQLILTDGRWFREPMPCSRRERWCRAVLADFFSGSATKTKNVSSDADAAWCDDFLRTGDPSGAVGGGGGGGSCCKKDDEWDAWCSSERGKRAPEEHRRALCDPTDAAFGMSEAVLLPASYAAAGGDGEGDEECEAAVFDLSAAWEAHRRAAKKESASSSSSSSPSSASTYYRRLVEGADSPVCEVLGQRQRRWLRSALSGSRAPLRIVASGSVLLGSLLYGEEEAGAAAAAGTPAEERAKPQVCSGDDWLCWDRAQVNFLHTLANTTNEKGGCVVVLAGDYHYSDLKVAAPPSSSSSSSPQPPAAAVRQLRLDRLAKPVYQLMSSGLTDSTAAQHTRQACEGSYREDLAGLRPLGKCSYVARPAFGGVEVNWRERWFELTVREAEGGMVAIGEDGARQRLRVSLDTCEVVEKG